MSEGENIHFKGRKTKEQLRFFPEAPRVDLNNLMKKVKEEEKRSKRNNLAVSVAALSAVAVFGMILTL